MTILADGRRIVELTIRLGLGIDRKDNSLEEARLHMMIMVMVMDSPEP